MQLQMSFEIPIFVECLSALFTFERFYSQLLKIKTNRYMCPHVCFKSTFVGVFFITVGVGTFKRPEIVVDAGDVVLKVTTG